MPFDHPLDPDLHFLLTTNHAARMIMKSGLHSRMILINLLAIPVEHKHSEKKRVGFPYLSKRGRSRDASLPYWRRTPTQNTFHITFRPYSEPLIGLLAISLAVRTGIGSTDRTSSTQQGHLGNHSRRFWERKQHRNHQFRVRSTPVIDQ